MSSPDILMSKFKKTAGRVLRCRPQFSTAPRVKSSGSGAVGYQQTLDRVRGGPQKSAPLPPKIRVCCIMTAGFGRCRTRASCYEFGRDLEVQTDSFRLDLKTDSRAGHRFMCNAHKEFIDAALGRSDEETETDCDSERDFKPPVKSQKLNWRCLHINTLRKYLQTFGIKGFTEASKDDLAYVTSLHSSTINVSGMEHQIVSEFIHRVRRQQFN